MRCYFVPKPGSTRSSASENLVALDKRNHILSLCSSAAGHSGCFCLLAAVGNAAANLIHVCLFEFLFSVGLLGFLWGLGTINVND